MALEGKSPDEVMEKLGPSRIPPPPRQPKEPLLTLKVRTPDQLVTELVEKVEPVLRPVMVYGGAALSLGGHLGGAVVGAGLILDPDPSASKAVGYYMLVVNTDGAVADVHTLWRGEPVPTVFNQGLKAGLIKLGRTESQAAQGANVVEFYSNTLQGYKMAMALPLGGVGGAAPMAGVRVATGTGSGAPRMTVFRTIGKGERVADLINEAKTLTYTTGNEHAVVTLADGARAIVSGGEGGITFAEGQVTRIFGHTHPYQLPPTGPSDADFAALELLDQRSSYVLEHGQLIRFSRGN
jgi:hypothetical protein